MNAADAIAQLAAWATAKRDEAERARDEARKVPDGDLLFTSREARADAYQAVVVECARRLGQLQEQGPLDLARELRTAAASATSIEEATAAISARMAALGFGPPVRFDLEGKPGASVIGAHLFRRDPPADEVRAYLQAHPDLAVEVVAPMKLAGPWRQDGPDQWSRSTWGGLVLAFALPDEHCVLTDAWSWCGPDGESEDPGLFQDAQAAMAACDAHLLAAGWLLAGGAP